MRTDPAKFATADRQLDREPRFIIRVGFPTASLYFTSHDDITGIPGVVLNNCVQDPDALSQRLVPDEGRSEIGAFSFSLIDYEAQVTEALKTHLADDEGFRNRQVKFYIGYKGFAFSDFVLFTTQTVTDDQVKDSVYDIQCRDITRTLNNEIFRPAATTLRASVAIGDSTVLVNDTTGFELVAHGTSYSDAPNLTVLYFRLGDEVFRATGKTANSFTGVTHSVLNTVAKEHKIDDNASQDRQPKVEEYIYIEMPGPKLAWAVLTRKIWGTANLFPPHWSLAIDEALVREINFTKIGLDLWNPADDTDSLVLRFEGLQAQDGKRFLERELYLLLGCFSPVYSDGSLGLRRMTPLISRASPVFTLTEDDIIELSPLHHDGESMHNDFQILWSYDPLVNDFVRQSLYIDEQSEFVHGLAPQLTYEFRGLHGERHTDITIANRLAAVRERYSTPPERLTVTAIASFGRVEIGDVGRVKVSEQALRDYYEIESEAFDRSFEVIQKIYDAASGRVELQLFGSTLRPIAQPPTQSAFAALPESFYTGTGTALTAVLTISGGVVQPGTYTLTGNADMRAAGSVFYYNGDLTIADGATIIIVNNVQLRIRGFLQINGDITGKGGGLAGVADPGGALTTAVPGNAGFLGHSRGWDGIRVTQVARQIVRVRTDGAALTKGLVDAMPSFEINAVSGALVGLPGDLRGGGGGPGGRYSSYISGLALGGTGGDGGAGLILICRGVAMGASGSVVLDGEDSAPTVGGATYNTGALEHELFPGSGGGGTPGAFLILLDGSAISFPLLGGKFQAKGGAVPHAGTPLPEREINLNDERLRGLGDLVGFAEPEAVTLDGHDYSSVAFGVQYIVEELQPEADARTRPPKPTNLAASSAAGGNLLSFTPPNADDYIVIEVWSSITQDRSDSVFVGEVKGSTFMHVLPLGERRYYWIRAARTFADGRPAVRSDWEPASPLGGVVSSAETPGEAPDSTGDFWAVGQVNGIRFTWALPTVGRMLGQVRIFEHSAPSPFASATKIFEGYGFAYVLPRTDLVTRYYWIQLFRGGVFSAPEPIGDGLPAAATKITAQLQASVNPNWASASVPPPPAGATTVPATVTASGGIPPYTYSWTWQSGNSSGTIVINSPTSPTTTFSTSNVPTGTAKAGVARCTVTDSLGFTVGVDFSVKFIGRGVVS